MCVCVCVHIYRFFVLKKLNKMPLLLGHFSCVSLRSHGPQPARLFCPWDSLGKSPGMGSPALIQGIFPNQGLNLGLLHCRWILCC